MPYSRKEDRQEYQRRRHLARYTPLLSPEERAAKKEASAAKKKQRDKARYQRLKEAAKKMSSDSDSEGEAKKLVLSPSGKAKFQLIQQEQKDIREFAEKERQDADKSRSNALDRFYTARTGLGEIIRDVELEETEKEGTPRKAKSARKEPPMTSVGSTRKAPPKAAVAQSTRKSARTSVHSTPQRKAPSTSAVARKPKDPPNVAAKATITVPTQEDVFETYPILQKIPQKKEELK
jgi:hypothetical protein